MLVENLSKQISVTSREIANKRVSRKLQVFGHSFPKPEFIHHSQVVSLAETSRIRREAELQLSKQSRQLVWDKAKDRIQAGVDEFLTMKSKVAALFMEGPVKGLFHYSRVNDAIVYTLEQTIEARTFTELTQRVLEVVKSFPENTDLQLQTNMNRICKSNGQCDEEIVISGIASQLQKTQEPKNFSYVVKIAGLWLNEAECIDMPITVTKRSVGDKEPYVAEIQLVQYKSVTY